MGARVFHVHHQNSSNALIDLCCPISLGTIIETYLSKGIPELFKKKMKHRLFIQIRALTYLTQ